MASQGLDEFIRKYDWLVKVKVRSFMAKNPRGDGYWLSEDLTQAAYMGLVQAFRTFDVSRGVQEQAYASLKIDYAILQEFDRQNFLSSRDIAKISRLNKDREKLEVLYGRPVTSDELAYFSIISDKDLAGLLRMAAICLQSVYDEEGNEIEIPTSNGSENFILRSQFKASLRKSFKMLTEREKMVMKLLFIDGLSLRQAGEILGIRKQSVAGTKKRFIRKIRLVLAADGVKVRQ